jgi:hypothetical protein
VARERRGSASAPARYVGGHIMRDEVMIDLQAFQSPIKLLVPQLLDMLFCFE